MAKSKKKAEKLALRKQGLLITVSSAVTLKFCTKSKLNTLHGVLREMRSCVNRYIAVCWKNPLAELNSYTQNLVDRGSLQANQQANCLQIALAMIASTEESAKSLGVRPSRPHMKETASVALNTNVCKVKKGKGSFDYILSISSLTPRQRIVIPIKSHKHLNDWLNSTDHKKIELLNSITINESEARLQMNVYLHPMKTLLESEIDTSKVMATDLGYLKLLAMNDGTFHGTNMKAVTDRVARAKPGSKGKLKARRARTHYINRQVNEIPWDDIAALGMEELKGIKQGKGKFGKKFRKKMAPWVHRQAAKRIEFKALVNRVHLETYDPAYTSRCCPPCGKVAKENRRGEVFRCVSCNYTGDADTVGAINGLAKTRSQLRALYGSPASFDLIKPSQPTHKS